MSSISTTTIPQPNVLVPSDGAAAGNQTAAADAPVAAAEAASSPEAVAADISNLVEQLSALGLAGLRAPSSQGDVSILLAQVSLTLEQTIGDARANRAANGLGGVSVGVGAFGLVALAETLQGNMTKLASTKGESAAFDAARTPLTARRDSLVTQIDGKNGELTAARAALAAAATDTAKQAAQAEVTALTGQIASLTGQKGDVEASIKALSLATLEKEVARLEAQGDSAPSGALAAKRAELAAMRTSTDVSAHLAVLQGEATYFTGAIAALQSSVDRGAAAASDIARIVQSVTVQLASTARGADLVNRSQDAARDIDVEAIFTKIAQSIAENGKSANPLLRENLGVRDILEDRDAEKRILAIAVGLMGAVSDLLATVAGLDPLTLPDPAGRAGQSRMRLAI